MLLLKINSWHTLKVQETVPKSFCYVFLLLSLYFFLLNSIFNLSIFYMREAKKILNSLDSMISNRWCFSSWHLPWHWGCIFSPFVNYCFGVFFLFDRKRREKKASEDNIKSVSLFFFCFLNVFSFLCWIPFCRDR